MTSKSLFFSMIRKDIKRRIWCPILIGIVFFLGLEVNTILQFQDALFQQNLGQKAIELEIFNNQILMPNYNGSVVFLMVASAIVCGLSSFFYLTSKTQIDLYHSLPIHRTAMFFSRYLSGIICFIVPFIFNMLITFIIAVTRNAVNGETILKLVLFSIYLIIYFISIYSVVILGVVLTGNFVLNVLGGAVLLAYSPTLWCTFQAMESTFFHTYLSEFQNKSMCLSPIEDLFRSISELSLRGMETNVQSYAPAINNLISEIIAIVFVVAIACYLYQKRPSEKAGKSMAFPISEPIIKTLVILPTSLLAGIFFGEISNQVNKFGWFLFGCIFGFILIGTVMEIIFRLDIKAAFKHFKYLALNFVLLIIIIVTFKLDLIGYDKYLPKMNQVESMAVSLDDIDSQFDYYENGRYISEREYRFKHMELTDLEAPYRLAEMATQNILTYEEDYTNGNYSSTTEYLESMKNRNVRLTVSVAYHLKNGKTKYRSYLVDKNDMEAMALLNTIYQSEEYKKAVFPILADEQKDYIKAEYTSLFDAKTIKLKEEKNLDFMDVYKKDLMQLTLEEMQTEVPIGSFCLLAKSDNAITYDKYPYSDFYGSPYDNYYGYPLYPSFENTKAWLKAHDIEYDQKFSLENILSVQIWNYNQGVSDNNWGESANVTFEDQESIQKIMENICYTFDSQAYGIMPIEDGLDVEISFNSSEGISYRNMYFKKDMIPQFVIDALDAYQPSEEMMK